MSTLALAGSERLIVVVGPSGAGKDSLLRAWRATLPPEAWVHFARRTITRPVHDLSEEHEAVSLQRFGAEREGGAFAFHWAAHHLHYGIRHAELAPLARGGWVVVNGSRAHLETLRRSAPAAQVVAVDAPAALRLERLGERGREDGESIGARLVRAAAAPAAALTIVNDGPLADAVARLEAWWQGLQGAAAG